VQQELETIPLYQDASEEILERHGRRFFPPLVNKYEDVENLDLIQEAQDKADKLNHEMEDNIRLSLNYNAPLEVIYFPYFQQIQMSRF